MARNLTPRDVIDRLTDGLTSPHADKWGEAMGAHFTIAHALENRPSRNGWPVIPSKWGFHDPWVHGLDGIDDPYTRQWIRMVKTETLIRAGEILHRYESCLERAGKSY